MNNWYFTADLHFDHPFMAGHRGFLSTHLMDEHLIRAWNETVDNSGVVVIAGDMIWSKYDQYIMKLLKKLKGNKIYIKGNHDYWIKKLKIPFKRIYSRLFKFPNNKRQYIVICHYPMASWNRKMYNAWQLHGHTHTNYLPLPRQLDIGVDNAKLLLGEYRPFKYEEVEYLLTTKDQRKKC